MWEMDGGKPAKAERVSRIFSPYLRTPPFPSQVIRLEFRHDDLEYYTELDAVEIEGYVLLNCKRHVYEGHWCFTVFVGLTKNFSRLNLHCFHNFVEAQGKILNLHLHVFK